MAEPYTGPTLDAPPEKKPYEGATVERAPLEFPDAPTTAQIEMPGTVRLPGALGRLTGLDKPTMDWGDKAAALYGTLMTDNPRARQEIYAKHLPGAKAVDDKFGNPMIEYQGKKYYTSRPGEFDAMDAGRLAMGTALSMPALAVAPASVTGAAVASGVTGGVQSLVEDFLARQAGGTSQEIDPRKAGTTAALGAAVPLGLGHVVMPLAGRLNQALRGPLTDEAIARLGINPANLTPELRQQISNVARRFFGNQDAVGAAYRTGLGRDFGVPLTRGEILSNPDPLLRSSAGAAQVAKEQTLAGPGNAYAQQTMLENRAIQDAQLTAAQNRLRSQVGGGTPLTQEEAGRILKQGYADAEAAAGQQVDQLYTAARDPATLQRMGITPDMPISYVGQLGDRVRANLARSGPGQVVINEDFGKLAPNAANALAAIDRWRTQLGPPGSVAINWDGIDNLRKLLGQYRDSAFAASGTKTDQAAMRSIMQSFDEHFTPFNSLLGEARAAHSAQMATFQPGDTGQDKATARVLEALQGPEGGSKVMNTIFGGDVKRGEAIQMIDHLNTQVFPNQPAARDALKEQALRRLTVDEQGNALSPQRAATAMQKALEGDRERPIYERLFSGEELAGLRRYYDLQRTLARSRTPINPPGSGLLTVSALKKIMGIGGGAAVGEHIGGLLGMPGAGAAVGAGAGYLGEHLIPRIQAARAVTPPPDYGVTRGPQALAAGLAAGQAAQQQPGPADQLMQRAWGLLGGP